MKQTGRRVLIGAAVIAGVVVFWLGNQVWARGRAGAVPGQPLVAVAAGVEAITSPRVAVSFDGEDLLAGVGAVLIAAAWLGYWRLSRPQRSGQEHGSARWGNESALRPLMNRRRSENVLLTREYRLRLDRAKRPEHQRNLNVLCIGGSGTGKSRYFVTPNLRNLATSQTAPSVLVTDPKGELLASCGGAFEDAGYRVRVLNLIDLAASDGFNPLGYLRTGHEPEDIQLMARTIIANTTPAGQKASDPLWERAETALINGLAGLVAATYPKQEQHLGSVMDLLDRMDADGDSPVDQVFQAASELPDASELLRFAVAQYGIYTKAAHKTAASIIVSTAFRLAPLHIPAVRRILSYDTLRLDEVGVEKAAVFAVISDSDKQFSWLSALMFSTFFQRASWVARQQPGGALPRPVQCWLDEFASIGRLPDFDVTVATIRSRGVSVVVIVQALNQAKVLYGETWETIVGNCDTTLFLGSTDAATRKWLSEALGKQTIRTVDTSVSHGRRGGSRNMKTTGRELLSADEIGRLPGTEAIVLVRGLRPLRGRKLPPAPEVPTYQHTPTMMATPAMQASANVGGSTDE